MYRTDLGKLAVVYTRTHFTNIFNFLKSRTRKCASFSLLRNLTTRTHDSDDDDDDGVEQHGGHTPNNGLTETCSLGLLCTSFLLDIHVKIN